MTFLFKWVLCRLPAVHFPGCIQTITGHHLNCSSLLIQTFTTLNMKNKNSTVAPKTATAPTHFRDTEFGSFPSAAAFCDFDTLASTHFWGSHDRWNSTMTWQENSFINFTKQTSRSDSKCINEQCMIKHGVVWWKKIGQIYETQLKLGDSRQLLG